MSYRNLKLHVFNLLNERNWSCSRQTYMQREWERECQSATRSLNVLMLAFTERCDITAYKIAHRELNYFWPIPVETARNLVPACHCKEGITQIAVVPRIENVKFSKILWGFRDRLLSVIRTLTWPGLSKCHTHTRQGPQDIQNMLTELKSPKNVIIIIIIIVSSSSSSSSSSSYGGGGSGSGGGGSDVR